jgi:hypothetical protein
MAYRILLDSILGEGTLSSVGSGLSGSILDTGQHHREADHPSVLSIHPTIIPAQAIHPTIMHPKITAKTLHKHTLPLRFHKHTTSFLKTPFGDGKVVNPTALLRNAKIPKIPGLPGSEPPPQVYRLVSLYPQSHHPALAMNPLVFQGRKIYNPLTWMVELLKDSTLAKTKAGVRGILFDCVDDSDSFTQG